VQLNACVCLPGPNHPEYSRHGRMGREPRSAADAPAPPRAREARRAGLCAGGYPGGGEHALQWRQPRRCAARHSPSRSSRQCAEPVRRNVPPPTGHRRGSCCPSKEGKADNFVNESRKSSGLLISCSKVQCETKKSAWGMEPGGKASSRVLPSCGRVVVPSSIRGRGTREGPFFSQLFGMQHRYACASCFLPFSPHLTKTQCFNSS